METSVDVTRYQPLKVDFVFFFVFFPIFLFLDLYFLSNNIQPRLTFVRVFTVIFVIIMLFRLSINSSFADYWRRNVRGYTAWYHKCNESGNLEVVVMPRKEPIPDYYHTACPPHISARRVCIGIALGGWFRRSVLARLSYSSYGFFRLRKENNNAVWLIDKCGDRLCLCIDEAIEYLDDGYMNPTSVLKMWRAEAKSWKKDALSHQQNISELLEDRVKILEDVISKLDGTKRFIKSKQAQEIRTYFVSQLYHYLHRDDPRRKKYVMSGVTIKG